MEYLHVSKGAYDQCWLVFLADPNYTYNWKKLGSFDSKEDALEYAYSLTKLQVSVVHERPSSERR